MKLQNLSGFAFSYFRIDTSYIENILHMLFDAIILEDETIVANKIKQIFSKDKLSSELSINDYNFEDYDSFVANVCDKLEEHIFSDLEIKESSFIIYIDKRVQRRQVCSYISDKGRLITPKMLGNEIEGWIREKHDIEHIIKLLVNSRYQIICDHICQLVKRSNSTKLILCDELNPVSSYTISQNDIHIDDCVSVELDPDAILFNPSFLSETIMNNEENERYAELQLNNQTIGIVLDGYVIPNISVLDRVESDKLENHIWSLICHVYKKESKSKSLSEELSAFLKDALTPSFNKILTNLKYNFYLSEDVVISNKYKKYFELANFYSKIKHIENLQICTNAKARGTNLGLYTPEKIGNEYNLLHWYSKSEQLEHYDSEEKKRANDISKVNILKPPYNYYLLHTYFEDVISAFLDEIGVEYIKNVIFQYGGSKEFEADFIIKLDHKALIIEAKTKLSEITIQDALEKKISIMKDVFNDTFGDYPIDYLICSQFSEPNLGLMEQYVLKLHKEIRPAFNDLYAYDFYFGEDNKDGKVRCIAEPDLKKLKRKILELCQR